MERVPGSVVVFTWCRAVRPYEVALGKVGARQRSHCNSLPCIGVDWGIVEVERVPVSVFFFVC